MQAVIDYLNGIRKMSPALEQYLRSILKHHPYKKGQHALKAGDICTEIQFIVTGLMWSYTVKDKKKVANWFMKRGDIIISILSFFKQIAAEDSIQALEATECWGITFAELWDVFERYPEFFRHGFIILTDYYCRDNERLTGLLKLDAAFNYARLMAKDPDLVQRVDNRKMASYFGVSLRKYNYIRDAFRKHSAGD
jgi:CRP/FNR family transcriptional regulator, anaerobic regulatory protein